MQQEKNQKLNLNLLQKSIRKRESIGMNVPPAKAVVGLMEKTFFTSLHLQKQFAETNVTATGTN